MATDTKTRQRQVQAPARAAQAQRTHSAATVRPWQSERDPVKALHHVVQHLTGGGPGNEAGKATKPMTESVKLNLATALQPLLAPYEGAIKSSNAAGAATAGPGASKQMQQASTAAPDLSQYLGQIQQGLSADPALAASGGSNLASTLTSGLSQVGQANQQMPGAIAAQGAQAGNAGLLTDLLNAAKYQAIYKQTDFGAPPTAAQDPALAQLYSSVVAGGNQLTNTLPTSVTQPGKTGAAGALSSPISNPFQSA